MLDLSLEQVKVVAGILEAIVPGRMVRVFGSRATGVAKPWSDLDLAILGNQPLSFTDMAALRMAFAESDLPFRVDLVDWSDVSDAFRQAVSDELTDLGGQRAPLRSATRHD